MVSPSHFTFLIFANATVRLTCTSQTQIHGTSTDQQVLRGSHQVRAMNVSTPPYLGAPGGVSPLGTISHRS
jgi:hypothetical protein